ncbi:response regulator transcription factor [Longispora sp. NPDC051575]|uniref:response regulator transcription factor n=1 Tax=Longispora sp. NPDC051575 TaxID=3154943 RepID=UPI00343E5B7A
MRVLVVEDDDNLRAAVGAVLRADGLAVDLVGDLVEADLAITVSEYDCVVFDRMLGANDSLGYIAAKRATGWTTPVLFLTARDTVADRLAGFDHGGDDYLGKPFEASELLARVRSLARRAGSARPTVVMVGDLRIDRARREVRRAGVLLSLTSKEFAVLELLAHRPDQVTSRSCLIEKCWDEMADPESNVVDALIARLRRKLGTPALIHTVRGEGFRLEPVG